MSVLRGQLLGQTSALSVVAAVEALAGLNAQTARGPSVGLWTRLANFRQADLDAALRSYELVKANLLRGTVHLVTRRQYVTWRLSLQPVLERTFNGFTPRFWPYVDRERLLARGRELLLANNGLTRADIGAGVAPDFPAVEPRHLGFAIRMLLPVVQVADVSSWRPGRTRYVLAEQAFADELVPAPDGLPDLVTAYQRAFGPGTAADVAYWSGASRLAAHLAPKIEPITDEEPRRTFVLPEFDNVYFSSQDTARPLIAAKKWLVRGGRMPGSLVAGDEVCGTWNGSRTTGTVELTAVRTLAADERAEFDRFRAWYEDRQ